MRVRTVKDHDNDYGVRDGLPYEKRNGRIYDIDDDAAAQTLIDAGVVEKADGNSESRGAARTGTSSK